MAKYVAIYNRKKITINAPNLYTAKLEALGTFKVPHSKRNMVSVTLVELHGKEVVHKADF